MNDEAWNRPLTADEMAATDSSAASQGRSAERWITAEARQMWDEAAAGHGKLAELYAAARGLDLTLIGPDEMRTAEHRSKPGAKGYPALLFSGTDADGEVQRLQAVRFKKSSLGTNAPRAERLKKGAKIISGVGKAPFRCTALSDCGDSRLLVCEGPEDALTLRQVTGCETWASFSLSTLHKMPVESGRRVVLFCDRGSEDQTRAAAERLAERGCRVWLAPAPDGFKDPNEALQADRADLIHTSLKAAEPVVRGDAILPAGFRVAGSGWIEAENDGDGGLFRLVRVCRGLRIVALARDAAGKGWGVLAEITTPDAQVHRTVIPHQMLAGRDATEVVRELRGLGLETYRSGEKRLVELLDRWRPDVRARTVQRLGWTDDSCKAFVLGDGRVIGEDADQPVVFDQMHGMSLVGAMRPAGTFETWQRLCCTNCLMAGAPLSPGQTYPTAAVTGMPSAV